MRNLFIGLLLSTLVLSTGCTTHSSGGNGAGQGDGQNGGQQNGGGNARATSWQCAIQFESGVVACGTYTSAATDAELRQHCQEIPGQVVAQCPVNNFQLTCLIKVDGADIRFRMAGAPEQRNEMMQICQQNNGQIQR